MKRAELEDTCCCTGGWNWTRNKMTSNWCFSINKHYMTFIPTIKYITQVTQLLASVVSAEVSYWLRVHVSGVCDVRGPAGNTGTAAVLEPRWQKR